MDKLVFVVAILPALVVGDRGDFVVANVTKSSLLPEQKVSTNKTVPVHAGLSTTPRPVKPPALNQPEKHFPVKAVSVNADSNGYAVLPMPIPPPFQFSDNNNGLEETFTYQVKKQHRRPFTSSKVDVQDEFNFLKDQVHYESQPSYEALQNYVNELGLNTSAKIQNLTNALNKLGNGTNENISALNTTFHQVKQEASQLTELFKENLRSTRLLQHIQEQDNVILTNKVLNITNTVELLRNQSAGEISKLSQTLSTLQLRLDNTTQELRIHEAYLRYGQQTMASMRGSMDKNSEKITELETAVGPQWDEQTVGCGGVIESNAGIISYKFRQPYSNNERCVWIIQANRRSNINLQLLEDGFQNQSNSDFLTVTELLEDQHPVTLLTSTRLEHGNKAVHTFQGPLIFITFYSDSSIPGTGFTLRFNGVGNATDAVNINAIRHTNLHFTESSGIFTYPGDNNGLTYQPNELVAVAVNPHNATFVKVQMKQSDLEKDEYCEFDSISFYGSVTGSYALTKRYCQQGEKFNGESVQSSDGIILMIFRSDASTQFSGFQFAWEME